VKVSESKWKYIKPLTSPDIVRKFSQSCDVDLPSGLMDFLSEHNAGRPPEREFETEDGRAHVFKCLFSYDPKGYDTVYDAHAALLDSDVDKSLFPIGCDPFGNFICYDTRRRGYAFIDHESGNVEGIVSSSNPDLFPEFPTEDAEAGDSKAGRSEESANIALRAQSNGAGSIKG
jgi:hypothetical protein